MADPVSIPFTGTLFLTSDSADDPSGRLHISTDRGAAITSGFTLNGPSRPTRSNSPGCESGFVESAPPRSPSNGRATSQTAARPS
jgi:hypothetical protein